MRIQPEVRGYVPVARGVTFAARGSLGFLFAFNYGDYVQHYLYPAAQPQRRVERSGLYNDVDRDIEIVYFRGFFSGGPSSNRGFPLRGIAPHGVVPFLSPATLQEQQQASSQQGRELHPGHAELQRRRSARSPSGASRCGRRRPRCASTCRDRLARPTLLRHGRRRAGARSQIRLNHLHLSCGAGARYDTPVGAIRLDLAYRIQPLQVLGYQRRRRAYERRPDRGASQPTFFGIPMALSFGIGETF